MPLFEFLCVHLRAFACMCAGPWSALSRKLEEAEAGRLSGRTGKATADKGGDVLDMLKYDMPQ